MRIFMGVYTEDSKSFHAGLLPNISRCLKANRHDAGVLIMEIENERVSNSCNEGQKSDESLGQNIRDSDRTKT